jgi:hypothetical protein
MDGVIYVNHFYVVAAAADLRGIGLDSRILVNFSSFSFQPFLSARLQNQSPSHKIIVDFVLYVCI